MRYMLLICTDPEAPSDPPGAPDIDDWVDEMDGRGVRQMGQQLAESSAATTVRVRDGKTLLTDGPFAETKEQLGGIILVDARDLNDAIKLATGIPSARVGCIEVRPVNDLGKRELGLRG